MLTNHYFLKLLIDWNGLNKYEDLRKYIKLKLLDQTTGYYISSIQPLLLVIIPSNYMKHVHMQWWSSSLPPLRSGPIFMKGLSQGLGLKLRLLSCSIHKEVKTSLRLK